MITLYTAPTPNGWKASCTLEELGLPYQVKPVNLSANEQKTPDFLKINPNGRIPAIVDHDAGDFAVFESGALMLYLAEKTGKLLPKDMRGRNLALQWLMWQMASLGPMHGQAHHFIRYAPDGQVYGVDRYAKEARRLMHVLEYRLREADYLAPKKN